MFFSVSGFETGSVSSVALAVLELAMWTRLASNSELLCIHLPRSQIKPCTCLPGLLTDLFPPLLALVLFLSSVYNTEEGGGSSSFSLSTHSMARV